MTLALLLACATVQLPEPDDAMAAASPGVTLAELQEGHALLRARCGNCHAPPHPEHALRPTWSTTFADMTRRARLAPDDARRIDAYMRAASSVPTAAPAASPTAAPAASPAP